MRFSAFRLANLQALAVLPQDSVQACCRLTTATLQEGCWDGCDPPPDVSSQVLDVLKLWRNICLVSARVTCQESPPPPGAQMLAAAAPASAG
ncbi:hypothetical protein C2E20_7181 [Micractinium conductrix]|uniref:Uncharacterized protein n=1 Tax=Micractinium conductrix TaxID=554055 RepID=A0A2P6V553_9CHLO|nr:hypothetical protein C2E20_7181 [Micractinium conductrix]|eukprot:PSC69215.1 hypothetical protein C2E20_7181 [Micractinium conductrix]